MVTTMNQEFLDRIICLTISHHRASVEELEVASFKDESAACVELLDKGWVEEVGILQTCNRVEVYLTISEVGVDKEALGETAEELLGSEDPEKIDILRGLDALQHLFEVSSGMVSMVSGEDEILGQVADTFEHCVENGFSGSVLNPALEKAVHVGKRVRNETEINSGPRSIGSAAIRFAEKNLDDVEDAEFAMIGAGDVAELVSKSLKKRGYDSVYITDKDLSKARKVAEKVGGKALGSEHNIDLFTEVDVVISATSAGDVIFAKEDLEDKIEGKTLMIDLANPRDVDANVGELDGVELFDLDSLNCMLEENEERREKEKEKVKEIVDQELKKLMKKYKEKNAEEIVKNIYRKAEEVREREVEKALRMLEAEKSGLSSEEREIIDEATRSIAEKILHDPVSSLKNASIEEDEEVVEVARSLFDLDE